MITWISGIVEGLFKAAAILFLVLLVLPELRSALGVNFEDCAVPVAVVLAVTGLARRKLGQMAFIAEVGRNVSRNVKRRIAGKL
jgi:hypothetical protein